MRNPNVIAKVISSKYFDFTNGSFNSEDSSLPKGHIGRIYNDACDEGFIMKSEKTGKEVIFALYATILDSDGDITHWIFHPSFQDIQQNPLLADVSVTIWND